MPWLFWRKRHLAEALGSPALHEEAASCSLTCGWMAATVLVGLGLDAVLGWWWAEDLARLAYLAWLVRETRHAVGEVREAQYEDA